MAELTFEEMARELPPLQYVQVHTKILTDDDFLDLSPEAKVLAIMTLCRAGFDNSDGRVRRNYRQMSRYTGLTPEECEEATAELIEMGWFVVSGKALQIRNWSAYQETVEERFEKRMRNRRNANQRWAKYRAEKEAESESQSESHTSRNAEKRREENRSSTAAPEKAPSATEIRSDLVAAIRTAIADLPPEQALHIFVEGLDAADAQAKKYHGQTKSKDLRKFLRQAVGFEASQHYLAEGNTKIAEWVALYGAPVLEILPGAAGMDEPVGYVRNEMKRRGVIT